MVGDERSGVGAGGDRYQNGRVHLDETASVQETADTADDAATPNEGVGDFRVGDKVEVALTVASFDVPEAVPFFGQGAHPLGENGQGVRFDGRLAGAGPHHVAADAEEISKVEVL